MQETVESVRLRLEQVNFSGGTPVWRAALWDVNRAQSIIGTPEKILEGIPDGDKRRGKGLLGDLNVSKSGE